MATRSLIGKRNFDGTVVAVYCHWDGYIEQPGVGYMLETFYQDIEKIDALLSEGDMSSIGTEIGDQHAFSGYEGSACTFYRRDRGEKDVDARHFPDMEAYWNQTEQSDAEYQYLFAFGAWLVKPRDGAIIPLAHHYALRTN